MVKRIKEWSKSLLKMIVSTVINIEKEENRDQNQYKHLWKLLDFHTSVGITYCGNGLNRSEKVILTLKKTLLIVYELITIISFVVFEYLVFSKESFNSFQNSGSKKIVLSFILTLSGSGMDIEFLSVKIITLIKRSKIVSTLLLFGISQNSFWTEINFFIFVPSF